MAVQTLCILPLVIEVVLVVDLVEVHFDAPDKLRDWCRLKSKLLLCGPVRLVLHSFECLVLHFDVSFGFLRAAL